MDRERELARNRLDQRYLALGPWTGRRAMEREHADGSVESGHRRRDHRLRAEATKGLCVALRLLELGRTLDVRGDDRPLTQRRQVRKRQILALRADRLQARRVPLGREPLRLRRAAQPDEAPAGAERPPHLGHRDPSAVGEPLDRPNPARDVRDKPLPGQCLVEGSGRARPLERKRRLGRQRLHQRQLFAREGALRRGRGGDEDADGPLLGDQRNEGAALGAGRLDQARADERRNGAVEDNHRRRLEVGACDPGWFVAEVEPDVAPPIDVAALGPGEQAGRFAGLLADQRQRGELDAQDRAHFVEKNAAGCLSIARPRQGIGDRGDRVELATARRDELLGLAGTRPAGEDSCRHLAPHDDAISRDLIR